MNFIKSRNKVPSMLRMKDVSGVSITGKASEHRDAWYAKLKVLT